MKKSKSAGTLISQEQIIKHIENSYNKKFQDLENKQKATQDIVSISEIKNQKLKLRKQLNLDIQNVMNNKKRISLEQKIEKTMQLKTQRRREILREITQKNHKFSGIVQTRKRSIEDEENKKVEDYLQYRKSTGDTSNAQTSLTSRDDPSKLFKRSTQSESLLMKREAIQEENINKIKEERSKHEEKRLIHLAEMLEKPGTTRWMSSASGGRMKNFYGSLPTSVCNTPRNLPIWDCINGYIGPAKTARTNSTLMSEEVKWKEDVLKRYCYKLSPNDSVLTIDQAMLYLQLRGKGCPKKEAINFSSRHRCRTDSTQRFDGPLGYKVLKRMDNRNQGPSWQGWQFHQAEYKSDMKYKPYKAQDPHDDYNLLVEGYEKFTKKYAIVNGVMIKKDDWEENCNSSMLSLPKLRLKTENSVLQSTSNLSLGQANKTELKEPTIPEIIETKVETLPSEETQHSQYIRHSAKSYTQIEPAFSVQRLLARRSHMRPPEDKIDSVEEKGSSKIMIRSVKPFVNPIKSLSSASSEFLSPREAKSIEESSRRLSHSKTSFPLRHDERTDSLKIPSVEKTISRFDLYEKKKEFFYQQMKKRAEISRSNVELIQMEISKKIKDMAKTTEENIKKSQERKTYLESQLTEQIQREFESKLQKLEQAENYRKSLYEEIEKNKKIKYKNYMQKVKTMKSKISADIEDKQQTVKEISINKQIRAEINKKELEQQKEKRFEEKRRDYDFSRMFSAVITKLISLPLSSIKEDRPEENKF